MRYSEERTTFSSIKIVLYSVYVPLSTISLFKNNAATRQVELCFVHAWYTTSLDKQPLQAFKLARGLPFRKEMSSTVYPRGCGWARSVSTCTVHLFSSCILSVETTPMGSQESLLRLLGRWVARRAGSVASTRTVYPGSGREDA